MEANQLFFSKAESMEAKQRTGGRRDLELASGTSSGSVREQRTSIPPGAERNTAEPLGGCEPAGARHPSGMRIRARLAPRSIATRIGCTNSTR